MEEGFFKLQMNYMLLWSAIDRYCKLKYNRGSEHDNRLELAYEDNFIDALRKIDDTREYRPIFSTDDLIRRSFDVSNPKYCINYYYTLRCNIVHRGKTSIRDLRLLKKATADLLEIFEYILDETFGEKWWGIFQMEISSMDFSIGMIQQLKINFIIGHNHKNMAVVAYHQEIQVFKWGFSGWIKMYCFYLVLFFVLSFFFVFFEYIVYFLFFFWTLVFLNYYLSYLAI